VREVPPAPPPLNPDLPTLFIAGDSTAARDGGSIMGWGAPFADYFDATKINVANRAVAGRSSRTFITGGAWDRLVRDLKAGDIVLIQFGHNDNGGINEEPPGSKLPLRARGTIPGLGEEAQEIDNVVTKQHEVVHTFGWYMRKMIAEVQTKRATPIVVSLTVRNEWKDGKVERGPGQYSRWTAEIAQAADIAFVDLTTMVADRYEQLGEEKVKAFFPNQPKDTTHTSPAAAELNASFVVAGLRALPLPPIDRDLSRKGLTVVPVATKAPK
jgi:lysophospholipase L1-like esterase